MRKKTNYSPKLNSTNHKSPVLHSNQQFMVKTRLKCRDYLYGYISDLLSLLIMRQHIKSFAQYEIYSFNGLHNYHLQAHQHYIVASNLSFDFPSIASWVQQYPSYSSSPSIKFFYVEFSILTLKFNFTKIKKPIHDSWNISLKKHN
jgi:hypothetical protein